MVIKHVSSLLCLCWILSNLGVHLQSRKCNKRLEGILLDNDLPCSVNVANTTCCLSDIESSAANWNLKHYSHATVSKIIVGSVLYWKNACTLFTLQLFIFSLHDSTYVTQLIGSSKSNFNIPYLPPAFLSLCEVEWIYRISILHVFCLHYEPYMYCYRLSFHRDISVHSWREDSYKGSYWSVHYWLKSFHSFTVMLCCV